MKKNIIIGVLCMVILLAFMYAFVQRAEAEKHRQQAEQMEQEAIRHQRVAEEMAARAKALRDSTASEESQ